jgi:hypothetical protein
MKTLGMLLLFLGVSVGAWAGSVGDAVEVRIRTDSGRELPLYPVSARHPDHRAYGEAVKGDQYTIVVRNRLGCRVGVVVAVDGRNIISGKKSYLAAGERMYILEPYGTGEYSGWRANLDRVNRFYFTAAADSYAGAFNDQSAMGVIAVAVYPEVQRHPEPQPMLNAPLDGAAPAPAGSAPAAAAPAARYGGAPHKSAKKAMRAAREESAGTGYGNDEYAPAYEVAFEAQGSAVERVYIKYEWRSTLYRLGIIGRPEPRPRNRMWDDGFAPPPPGRG